jgi:hypothetical protein
VNADGVDRHSALCHKWSYNVSIDNPATEKQRNVLARAGYSRTELEGLSVGQASTLLDCVSRNNWKRPNVAQTEAIVVGGQLLEEEKATEKAFVMARIPTRREVDEFTKDMGNQQGFAIEEAISDLKWAVEQGEKALVSHGSALAQLKANCKHGEWRKLLALLRVPPATAHRQIQLAIAHSCIDAKTRKVLEFKGIRFRSTMTAQEVQIVQKAAEVAKEAEKEAQMSHPETFDPGDTHSQAIAKSLERDKQIEAVVEEKVGSFVDSQLPGKPPQARIANPTQDLRLQPAEAENMKFIAWDIAGLIMQRLNAQVPSYSQSEVWSLVVEYVEGEGGLRRNKVEVANGRS